MQEIDNRLEYLLKQDLNQLTIDEFVELIEEIQTSELLLPIEAEFTEDGGYIEPTIIIGPKEELITPIFTDENQFKGHDIEVFSLDGGVIFEMLKDYGVDSVFLNPFTNKVKFEVETLLNKSIGKKVEFIKIIRRLLHNNSTTLSKDVDLYYRTPVPIEKVENKLPINASSDMGFKEELEYLNIFKMSKGDKIMVAESVFKKAMPFHIIIAPETEFELIEKKDDNTFIWKCINQPFYD